MIGGFMSDNERDHDDFMDFFENRLNEGNTHAAHTGGRHSAPSSPPAGRKALRHARERDRRNKGRRRASHAILAVLLAAVLLAADFYTVRGISAAKRNTESAQKMADCSDYPGPGAGSVNFTIAKGESASSISQRLEQAGIVRTSCAFSNAASGAGAAQSLQPGTFELKKGMKASDVVTVLSNPNNAKSILNIVAGDTVKKVIRNAAAAADNLTEADFRKVIDNKGAGILPAEAKGSFEGWLQPGTYDIKDAASAGDVLKQIVQARIKHLDDLKVPSGKDRETILTKASIIGAEVNRSEYYGKVARVIENRLAKDMPLGMDAINVYGLGLDDASQLTSAQLADPDDPYNSRIQKGLPPTPIGSANDASIAAAINPVQGNWLYFVTVNTDTGETKFTDNGETFNQYSREYHEWLKNKGSSK